MIKAEPFDYEARKRQKQAWREEDQRRLDSGEVSPAELRRQNMFFGGGWTFDPQQPGVNIPK